MNTRETAGIAEARELLAELETFWANDAGERAIRILRKIVAETAVISSAKLIERTGGNPGPVDTRGFPSDLREASDAVLKAHGESQ